MASLVWLVGAGGIDHQVQSNPIYSDQIDRRSQVREDVEALYAIEESDLVNAASKLNTYLQTNTVLTPALTAQIAGSITA